jgi:hypothetical protein
MQMYRQRVVCMVDDAMVLFPGRVHRVDVNDCVFEVRQMVQQLMSYLGRDRVTMTMAVVVLLRHNSARFLLKRRSSRLTRV